MAATRRPATTASGMGSSATPSTARLTDPCASRPSSRGPLARGGGAGTDARAPATDGLEPSTLLTIKGLHPTLPLLTNRALQGWPRVATAGLHKAPRRGNRCRKRYGLG